MKTRLATAIALVIGFAASAALAQELKLRTPEGEGKSLQVPEGSVVAPGKAPDMTLLYTGDVIGFVKDCGCKMNPAGGLARRSWLLQQLRAAYPDTPQLLLDSGNFSDNPSEEGEIRTQGLLEGMAKLGYQVANVGERELALGYEEFRKRTEGSPIQFVSANVVRQDTKAPVFRPFTIVEVKRKGKKPLRVGVTGVARYSPGWQKAGPDQTNLVMARPAEGLRGVIEQMKKSADVVVLLAALSKSDATQIVTEVPGIDFVLGSYGGAYDYNEALVSGARIYYSGNQGKRMGETRVYLGPGEKVATANTYMHFMTAAYHDDPAMAAFVDEVTAKVNKAKGTLQAPAEGQPGQAAPGAAGTHGSN